MLIFFHKLPVMSSCFLILGNDLNFGLIGCFMKVSVPSRCDKRIKEVFVHFATAGELVLTFKHFESVYFQMKTL